jgi:hypothetical protein
MIYNKVFFVASTLPLKYIIQNYDKNILILIKNHEIYKAYEFLKKEKKNIELKLLSRSFILRFFNIFFLIIYYKLKNIKFTFFHECCWPEFDIIIKIFNPKSFYIPIVKINHKKFNNKSEQIGYKSILKLKILNFFFYNLFTIYYHKEKNYTFFFSLKKYPPKVIVKKFKVINKKHRIKNKKILFIVSREPCDNSETVEIYKKISDMFKIRGYKSYYKDHPNKNARLNVKFLEMCKINPNKPFELIENNFDYLVGSGSTPLSYKGSRSISIIRLIKSYKKITAKLRMEHLKSNYDGKKINFPFKIRDIIKIIK